jgi:hypothetical protein
MSDDYRQERIERLLHELKYEITRGMMEGDLDETLGFEFVVPISKRIPDGIVWCRFQTRPMHRYAIPLTFNEPKLRVVKP